MAAGRLGRKNGKGFYEYEGSKRARAGAGSLRGAPRESAGALAAAARGHRVPPRAADDQRGRVLPRGPDRARAREARPRHDLRNGVSAVSRRPPALRRRARPRPRVHAPRRSVRAPRVRDSRRPSSSATSPTGAGASTASRPRRPREITRMTERLDRRRGARPAPGPRRQVAVRGRDPRGHGFSRTRRSPSPSARPSRRFWSRSAPSRRTTSTRPGSSASTGSARRSSAAWRSSAPSA